MNRTVSRPLPALLAAAALLLAGTGPAAAGEEWKAGKLAVGQPAPEFALQTLDGTQKALSEMKGKKVVLLVMWAVWCPPCIEEVPLLNGLHRKFAGRGLEILALGVAQGQDERAVRRFLERNEVLYPVLFDSEDQVAPEYGVLFVPHNVLIGPDGNVAYEGTTLPKDIEERIETLLEQVQAPA